MSIVIRNREYDFDKHTYVMGILNMTPDSFSDGGKWNENVSARKHVQDMIEKGAAIIDVGGESTRPGFDKISCEEEINRTIPIISWIRENYPDILISIDTTKAAVAKAALEAGADIINDVSGLYEDADMASVAAKYDAYVCLMHNGLYFDKNYSGEPHEEGYLEKEMKMMLDNALASGIKKERIILDPGVGFGKTQEENAQILANLGELHSLGCPLLLGTSRKSVFGFLTGLQVNDRLEGTMVASVLAVQAGYAVVRVHDVEENYRAVRTMEEIRKWTR